MLSKVLSDSQGPEIYRNWYMSHKNAEGYFMFPNPQQLFLPDYLVVLFTFAWTLHCSSWKYTYWVEISLKVFQLSFKMKYNI